MHLFIVGAGRSGTTFLWRILNNSQQVHLCTEIHYFSWIYHNGFLKNFRRWRKTNSNLTSQDLYLSLTTLNHFGMYWQKNPYFIKKEIDQFFRKRKINEKSIYEFLLLHDLQLSQKNFKQISYVGEKTPVNVFHLNEILNWFPEATILFIFRDPIMVLKSEANKKFKPDYPMAKSNPLYHIGITVFVFFEWLLAGLIALRYSKKEKYKFLIINYESLIHFKHENVESLCNKLGISFNNIFCEVDKIGSSFSPGRKSSYWQPGVIIRKIFYILNPLYNRLKNSSIM